MVHLSWMKNQQIENQIKNKKCKEMKTINKTGSKEPTVFITVNKQRVKQYDDKIVYLKNGQEFEIEFFNPTDSKISAEIEINGKSIGNAIIIKPGQRAYLDRFINKPKKFLFETYDIDLSGEDKKAVLSAISNNGNVKIKFYRESVNFSSVWVNRGTTYYPVYPTYPSDPIYPTFPIVCYSSSDNIACSSSDIQYTQTSASLLNKNNSNSLETGRVERGSNSKQTFSNDYSNYEFTPFQIVEWQILPESRRVIETNDLVVYCTNCGAKRKKQSHKFCPHCGTKF